MSLLDRPPSDSILRVSPLQRWSLSCRLALLSGGIMTFHPLLGRWALWLVLLGSRFSSPLCLLLLLLLNQSHALLDGHRPRLILSVTRGCGGSSLLCDFRILRDLLFNLGIFVATVEFLYGFGARGRDVGILAGRRSVEGPFHSIRVFTAKIAGLGHGRGCRGFVESSNAVPEGVAGGLLGDRRRAALG